MYQRVAKYILNRDQNLDILCAAWLHRNCFSDDLPTWVPDWRVGPPDNQDRKDYFDLKYAASGFTKTKHQPQKELGVLKIQGYIVDIVVIPHGATCTAVDLLNGSVREIQSETHPGMVEIENTSIFRAFEHSSRCCTTIAERLCLVPAGAKTGDKIFVLLGSKIPFILRECSDQQMFMDEDGCPDFDNLKWEMLGPCCVPDLMYGHLMSMIEKMTTDVDLLDITVV